MKLRILAAALALGAVTSLHAEEKVLAVVNGEKITQAMVDQYGTQQERQVAPERLLNGLVNQEIAYQEANHSGLAKDAQIQLALEMQKRTLLATFLLQKQLQDHPVTDAEMKKLYEEQVLSNHQMEYKARHILLADEAAAKAVIADLDKGADFATLAKERSTGPSKKDGGDLGWFQSEQMVKPFSEAAAKLKKGEYTKTPVQTRFGWHVILLEDSRNLEPPAFDALKPRLKQALEGQRIAEFLSALKAKAKVEIK